MPRDLSPDERALWRRVTRDVRATESIEGPLALVEATETGAVGSGAKPVSVPGPAPRAAPRSHRAGSLSATTLDANWDRRLKAGLAAPDRVIDLHNLTLERAYARTMAAIDDALANGDRVVVFVTGKPPPAGSSRLDDPLRGRIRATLADWLAASPLARHIAAIRPAHPRHGGAGALYVILRRQRA